MAGRFLFLRHAFVFSAHTILFFCAYKIKGVFVLSLSLSNRKT